MRLIACTNCKLAIRVLGDPFEIDSLIGFQSDFFPDKYVCPSCSGKAHFLKETESDISALSFMELKDLTPQEAFIALSGLGLPEERSCGKQQIQELLKNPIRKIIGQESQTGRFILEHLELWDGTRMYFGASPQGAVIYKISPPPNYSGTRYE